MTKTLIRFVDSSLFPAAALVAGKFLGLILTFQLFGIGWSLKQYAESFFSIGTSVRLEDLALATSYSDLFMYVFIALFFSFSVIRAVFFHASHVKPSLVIKLANKNLLNLIQSSYKVYNYAFVWLLFAWIGNILILVNVTRGTTYLWVGIVVTISSIVLSVILLEDLYKEIENIKNHPGKYKWE